jgi:Zn-dependent M28 family amino/carboxypeptidase
MVGWLELQRGHARLAIGFCVLICGQVVAEENVSEARMRKDVFFLASDECEGRGVTTQGINLAADYIANEFKKAGLQPAGADGTYFQPFPMSGASKLESPNSLVLVGPNGQEIELKLEQHFMPMGLSRAGKANAPVVFAGYAATTKNGYDDFKDIDVAGKVVVVIRKTPRSGNAHSKFDGNLNDSHAALVNKVSNANKHKAAAVLFVNHFEDAVNQDALAPFSYLSSQGMVEIPAVHVRRSLVDDMIQASFGTRLHDLELAIDRDLKPKSALLPGWTARLEVTVKRTSIQAKNVVGVLEGTGPKAKETIVLGAHYDHLGYGGRGSLARLKNSAIHHGADDNGSGTTALMELARRFAQMPNRNRRLVFIAFSGEESGLIGSAYYCKNPLIPLNDIITMVNMDMVGRLRPDKQDANKDKLIVYGTGTAKTFDKLIEDLNENYGFKLQKITGGYGPSDHASFYAKGIPVFFFFTGDHPDYHRPSDTADKINIPGMKRVTDLMEELVSRIISTPERPEYVKVASSARSSPGRGGPVLKIRPDYGDEGEGVLLDDVIAGGPAEKAGMKSGDRIVEIAGQPVKNLTRYMELMNGKKAGEPLEISVLRNGKKLPLKVVPE